MMHDNKQEAGVRTSTLFRRLFAAPNLDTYITENLDNLRDSGLPAYLQELCDKTGEVRNQVIIRSGMERTFGHQIFRGVRKPSRDIVIRLAFGFRLGVEEAQRLLAAAQKSPLFPRIKRDAAVLYCLNHRCDVTEVQAMLEELGLRLLDGEAGNE